MTTKKKASLNVGLLLLTFLVNFLGDGGFINGMSQVESDRYIVMEAYINQWL